MLCSAMKSCIISLLILFISCVTMAQSKVFQKVTVAGNRVNIRTEPNLTCKVKYQKNWGAKFLGARYDDEWIELIDDDNNVLYGYHKYIKFVDPEIIQSPAKEALVQESTTISTTTRPATSSVPSSNSTFSPTISNETFTLDEKPGMEIKIAKTYPIGQTPPPGSNSQPLNPKTTIIESPLSEDTAERLPDVEEIIDETDAPFASTSQDIPEMPEEVEIVESEIPEPEIIEAVTDTPLGTSMTSETASTAVENNIPDVTLSTSEPVETIVEDVTTTDLPDEEIEVPVEEVMEVVEEEIPVPETPVVEEVELVTPVEEIKTTKESIATTSTKEAIPTEETNIAEEIITETVNEPIETVIEESPATELANQPVELETTITEPTEVETKVETGTEEPADAAREYAQSQMEELTQFIQLEEKEMAHEKAVEIINNHVDQSVYTHLGSCVLIGEEAYARYRSLFPNDASRIPYLRRMLNDVYDPLIVNIIRLDIVDHWIQKEEYQYALDIMENIMTHNSESLVLPKHCENDPNRKASPQIELKNKYFLVYHLLDKKKKEEILNKLKELTKAKNEITQHIAEDIYNKISGEFWEKN